MGRKKRSGGFEIRDVLPGWSHHKGAFTTLTEDGLDDIPDEELDISVELTIAPRHETVGGRFSLTVATPAALMRRPIPPSGVLTDRATLLVSNADWDGVRQHLESIVQQCVALDFEGAVGYLNRYFRYEYDDFSWSPGDARRRRQEHPALRILKLHTSDGQSIRSLYPYDAVEIDYDMHMRLGHPSQQEELNYRFRIVSPAALGGAKAAGFHVLADRATLVVGSFEWRDVLTHLESLVQTCSAARIAGNRALLSRYFEELPG